MAFDIILVGLNTGKKMHKMIMQIFIAGSNWNELC
jgi:hypothetical protein